MIRAARYGHVAPWELAGIPESAGHECWMRWLLWSEEAEAKAVAQARKQQSKTAARRR